jgi:hypothetical protein
MKKHIYCFAHMQMMEARELMLRLPPPEDANAIQIGLMRIQKSLIEDTISTKKAGLLLYSMQLALQNVGQTTFGQAKEEEMVRNTVDEEEALSEEAFSNQHSAVSQKQHQHQRPFTSEGTEDTEEGKSQNKNLFTAKPLHGADAEDAKEEKGLPQVDADPRLAGTGGRGLKVEIRPVEWKPTPDMYRTDTPEGREAYEASFQMKIKPGSSGERRPQQAAVGTGRTC